MGLDAILVVADNQFLQLQHVAVRMLPLSFFKCIHIIHLRNWHLLSLNRNPYLLVLFVLFDVGRVAKGFTG